MTVQREISARVIRPGEPIPVDRYWLTVSPADRIAGVRTLTRLCLAWNNPDSREPRLQVILSAFNAEGVEYLVVGAHALAAHGHVRATRDLGVWVRSTTENAHRVIRALAAFGAPLQDLAEADLTRPGLVFQIGVPPVRIDVLTSVDGLEFPDAWRDRLQTTFAGQPVAVPSLDHMIENKKASGRLQDLADVERLEAILKSGPGDPMNSPR